MAEEKHELTTSTNPHFLSFILLGDDFQVSQNDSETKRQGLNEPGINIFRVKNVS
jgi:hypothetical protein